ncbi:MAG TPA: sodium:proton antiporter [Gammaproteobacteria bacterium]|jgi:uncharacterized MnhB-related membrane protein|nr:sodium:proton antiporter [Gammaproteobacteria bacterium]
MSPMLFVDGLLASGAIALALLSLNAREVFTSIVLFVCLGLLATLIWARLGAWDVAIAEAAIGAGLTGALLLAARHRLREPTSRDDTPAARRPHVS